MKALHHWLTQTAIEIRFTPEMLIALALAVAAAFWLAAIKH